MIACAALIFIALATYSAGDEATAGGVRLTHLWGVLTGDQEAKRLLDTTHNGLGLVGVMVSEFLIRGTVGFSIYAFPVLLVLWGWTILAAGRFPPGNHHHQLFHHLGVSSFGLVRDDPADYPGWRSGC